MSVNTGNKKTYKETSELPQVKVSSYFTNITLSCFSASSLQSHILVLGLTSHTLRAVTSSAFSTADQQVKNASAIPPFQAQEPNIHSPLGLSSWHDFHTASSIPPTLVLPESSASHLSHSCHNLRGCHSVSRLDRLSLSPTFKKESVARQSVVEV
jgi:hypothetical protein